MNLSLMIYIKTSNVYVFSRTSTSITNFCNSLSVYIMNHKISSIRINGIYFIVVQHNTINVIHHSVLLVGMENNISLVGVYIFFRNL